MTAATRAEAASRLGGRATRRRERRIAGILSAAAKVLASGGYHMFSLEAVADSSDLSKTSLYHYYLSKDALISAALEQLGASLALRLEELASDTSLRPRDRLRALIVDQLTILLIDNPEVTGLFTRPQDWPEGHRLLLKELRRRHYRIFRNVVLEGIATSELSCVEPDVALHCMHGALNSIGVWYQRPRQLDEVQMLIEQVADTVMALFSTPRQPSGDVRRRHVHRVSTPRHGGREVVAVGIP